MATPRRWLTVDHIAAIALFALALGLRLQVVNVPPYGDEGAYYGLARSFEMSPQTIQHLYPYTWYEGRHLVFLFPLLPAVLSPGAQFGFLGLRVEHVLLTSLVPATGYLLLRRWRTPAGAAATGGAILAIQPHFVVWGTLVLPDAMTALAILAALLARAHHRPGLSLALLLAAAWIKETGLLVLGALTVWDLLRSWSAGRLRLHPRRWERIDLWRVAVLVVAPIPFILFVASGGPVPGGGADEFRKPLLDQLVVTGWTWTPLVLGIGLSRARRFALLGLLYPVFFLLYHQMGRSVEIWYVTIPATLAVVAVTGLLNEARSALPGRARALPWTVGLLLTAVVALQCLQPAAPAKAAVTMPASHAITLNLEETIEYERARDGDVKAALQWVGQRPDVPWLFVDVYWSRLIHPFDAVAPAGSRFAYSYDVRLSGAVEASDRDVAPIARAFEHGPVLLERAPFALNRAINVTYADCATQENPSYVLFSECGDRVDALRQEYEAQAGVS